MSSAFPRWSPIRRATRRRAARVLEVVLCALLVFGLIPVSDELIETVAHLVHDGHLPHSEQHEEVAAGEACADSDEHGCTPLAHHCKCCPSVPAVPPGSPVSEPLQLTIAREPYLSGSERGPPIPGVKPFLRPPIA